MPSLRKETTDVLVEVVYLIERLEADRHNAEEALLVEKKRRRTLGKKMDYICLWRQQEFPVAVQKGQRHKLNQRKHMLSLLFDILTTLVPGFSLSITSFQSTRLARETFVSCSGT